MVAHNVSGQFVHDHIDRQPEGEPVSIVRTHKRGSVTISGTPAQFSALLSDARYYADPYGPDMLPEGLAASARRLIPRIRATLEAAQ